MKVTSPIFLSVLMMIGIATSGHAQTLIIDSSLRTLDVAGQFNGAPVQLSDVKKPPEYPGGKKAWQDYLRTNINVKIPIEHHAIPGTYKVMIRFIVLSDGRLSGIGADSNFGYGMEAEVIRCINKSAAWIPAETSSNRKVNFTLRTIVIFTIKQNGVDISF